MMEQTAQTLKMVFAGFRHGHIYSLYRLAQNTPGIQVCACCEEDAEARKNAQVPIDYDNFDEMLDAVPCDIVAIGDYYAKRGSLAVAALRRGKHVIADKPLCTTLAELEEMRRLAAQNHLCIGCMYELRGNAACATGAEIVRSGKLGKITQIIFTGQHPLNHAGRPGWYFEPGKHGGTINDIAGHALDLISGMTGEGFGSIVGARCWHAFEPKTSPMRDAAQLIYTLKNGCGVMGDVSYAAPDSFGSAHCCYWRFNVWGTNGMIEFKAGEPELKAYFNGETTPAVIPADPQKGVNYFNAFLNEINGAPGDLCTASVLDTAEALLKLQSASLSE